MHFWMFAHQNPSPTPILPETDALRTIGPRENVIETPFTDLFLRFAFGYAHDRNQIASRQ
jgi:hypothetical protein